MNGNWKEAHDGCGAGVVGTGTPEEKKLQLRQRHNELGNIIVVQFEDTRSLAAPPIAAAVYI